MALPGALAERNRPSWMQGLFSYTPTSVRTTAQSGDLYSRFNSLPYTATQFVAEAVVLCKDKNPDALNFFMNRWFILENMSRTKTEVYEDVISKLVDALNDSLKLSGKKYSKEMVAQDHVKYFELLIDEAYVNDLSNQSASQITGSAVDSIQSNISKGIKKIIDLFYGTERVAIRPRNINIHHKDNYSDDILTYPYARKLEFLKKCKEYVGPSGGAPTYSHACTAEYNKIAPEGNLQEYIDKTLANIKDDLSQIDKNTLVDVAIHHLYPPKPPPPPSIMEQTAAAVPTVEETTTALKSLGKTVVNGTNNFRSYLKNPFTSKRESGGNIEKHRTRRRRRRHRRR